MPHSARRPSSVRKLIDHAGARAGSKPRAQRRCVRELDLEGAENAANLPHRPSRTSTLEYGSSCSRPMRRNSAAMMPSRVTKLWTCTAAAFRGGPESQSRHASPRPPERKRGGEPRWSAANNDDVVDLIRRRADGLVGLVRLVSIPSCLCLSCLCRSCWAFHPSTVVDRMGARQGAGLNGSAWLWIAAAPPALFRQPDCW